MKDSSVHSFHIPVLGLAFSIDTPIRVARFGISSVISVVDDILIEQMRKHYGSVEGESYVPISRHESDYRARRITEYLNLVQRIVRRQVAELKASAFEVGSDIVKYFEMLADRHPSKTLYLAMARTADRGLKAILEEELRSSIVAGAIDINIMTKLNKSNSGSNGEELPVEYSDALAALRGFAKSDLDSSVVLSAGMNPRLFSYLGQCEEFLPDRNGVLRKKVILKVSDHRSALIQGRVLAKKGIWISEFRVESGLNCGGHAFATDGELLGPILEEFKTKRKDLVAELHTLYTAALRERGLTIPLSPFGVRITVQGGIGTASEDRFLREYFEVDGTGWGSPFLLVPEATNVDAETRQRLADALEEDFYLSDASPLGIPFNNLRGSSSEDQIRRRVNEGRPGSPCTKKYLVSNTEFTDKPICTASRQYQSLKIKQLESMGLPGDELVKRVDAVTVKSCLCEDLAAPGIIMGHSNGEPVPPVAVCPGPNLAFFAKIASLEEMVGHIYGRTQLLSILDRPNMFINELRLYIDYLRKQISSRIDAFTIKEQKQLSAFRSNLMEGIGYYKTLIPRLAEEGEQYCERMHEQLLTLEQEIIELVVPVVQMETIPS
jgi:hypothetical protein